MKITRKGIYESEFCNKGLISRDDVIKAIDKHTTEDGKLDEDISVILEEVKTAFDKESVLKELKVISHGLSKHGNFNSASWVDVIIKIVEKGGV